MGYTSELSKGLLTDLYQLTMAQAYHSAGVTGYEACFHLFFRENPFGGGFAVACGLEQAIDYLEGLRFTADDIAYLSELPGSDGRSLFAGTFLAVAVGPDLHLRRRCRARRHGRLSPRAAPARLRSDRAVPDRRDGTAELHQLPDADRHQGGPGAVLRRRAIRSSSSGCDGRRDPTGGCRRAVRRTSAGATAPPTRSRASGSAFPCRARMHTRGSWRSTASSRRFAPTPTRCPTTASSSSTPTTRCRAHETRSRSGGSCASAATSSSASGSTPATWRGCPSAYGRSWTTAGFSDAKIVASNELDEHLIASLKDQGAAIDVWGVGTKLATSWDQPALGGVYKLSAIRRDGGPWEPRIKVSEQTAKVTTPGVLGVRRYRDDSGTLGRRHGLRRVRRARRSPGHGRSG